MARNFLAVPFGTYKGTLSGRPFNGAGGKALMVQADVAWFTYSIGVAQLGTANPDFNVIVDLNAAASNIVSQVWVIRSVYIDNEGSNFPAYVFFPDTGFAVSCPPNSSGWYQVFAASRKAFIIALGLSDTDINNQARTRVFFTDAVVTSYLDQEQPTAVEMGIASPLISLSGAGGQVTSFTIVDSGQWLASGSAYTITGGGGAGAVISTLLNQFGSVTSATATSSGNNYQTPPSVTYTGGFNVPAAWSAAGVYVQGNLVSSAGFVWVCNINNGPSPVPPESRGFGVWSNTSLTSDARAPTILANISPSVGAASFSNLSSYGPAALGDQVLSTTDLISATGDFRTGIFGTPASSGFIYIQGASVNVGAVSTPAHAIWTLQTLTGNVIFNFDATLPGPILQLAKCNIKIPATLALRMNCTAISGTVSVQHNFVYTYSPIG